jgi:hypothetical protein
LSISDCWKHVLVLVWRRSRWQWGYDVAINIAHQFWPAGYHRSAVGWLEQEDGALDAGVSNEADIDSEHAL